MSKLINIYDMRNKDRLLGHFPEDSLPELPRDYPWFRVAVCPPLPIIFDRANDPLEVNVKTAEFCKDWEQVDPYTKRLALYTRDPLEDLLMIRWFRLPGENERQAEERQFAARWFN